MTSNNEIRPRSLDNFIFAFDDACKEEESLQWRPSESPANSHLKALPSLLEPGSEETKERRK